jgi:hypothetical protein
MRDYVRCERVKYARVSRKPIISASVNYYPVWTHGMEIVRSADYVFVKLIYKYTHQDVQSEIICIAHYIMCTASIVENY